MHKIKQTNLKKPVAGTNNFKFLWANKPIRIFHRQGSTDDNAINEVLVKRAYRRSTAHIDVKEGDHWLDLGANIGAFGIYCYLNGATATCYEPDPECFKILRYNLGKFKNFTLCNTAVTMNAEDRIKFYRSADPTNFYRNTEVAGQRGKSGPYEQYTEVDNIFFGDLPHMTGGYEGIKMDIEGSELPLLDDPTLLKLVVGECPTLIMEYHINRDKGNLTNFRSRLKTLRKMFKHIYYPPSIDRMGDTYTGRFDFIIFCHNDLMNDYPVS